jgi:hypothetical protein
MICSIKPAADRSKESIKNIKEDKETVFSCRESYPASVVEVGSISHISHTREIAFKPQILELGVDLVFNENFRRHYHPNQ